MSDFFLQLHNSNEMVKTKHHSRVMKFCSNHKDTLGKYLICQQELTEILQQIHPEIIPSFCSDCAVKLAMDGYRVEEL